MYQKNIEELQQAGAATVKDRSWLLAPPPLEKEAVSCRPQVWRHRAHVGILQTTFRGSWKTPSCEPAQRWRGSCSRSRLWFEVLTWAMRPRGPYGIGGISFGKRHHVEFLARLLRFCHKAMPCGNDESFDKQLLACYEPWYRLPDHDHGTARAEATIHCLSQSFLAAITNTVN